MLSFKQVYLAYVAILAILVGSATFYVRSLLRDYEAAQPEQRAWEVAEALASDATAGRFWDRFPLPAVSLGPYEQGMDLQTGYPALFTGEDLRAIPKSGQHGEDELTYLITSGDFPLAEVHLQAVGPAVTRLGLFTTREWAATDIQLLLEPRDYYMDLPPSHYFTVRLNGQDLTADASGRYSVSGLYLKPVFAIADPSGAPANYAIKDGQILPELYSYDLTLPAALLVDTDKGFYQGNAVENDQIRHVIASIEKPSVTISDTYGNTIPYEGGALPLTRITITAEEGYTVSVQGQPAVPNRTFFPDEYAHFAEFVPGLPQTQVYDIVILRENGEAVVTDPAGTAATLLAGEHTLTAQPAPLDAVPAELGVDVLDIAQKWSLFMSNDLAFSKVSPYLIWDSYQYQVAYRYAHGIDITFTSRHTLAAPPFTDAAATNFQWLAEGQCFSVDIHFVKHMRLASGMAVDDTMNDRFYFVLYDDTDNGIDDPAWKIGGMKEIVENGKV